MLVALVICFAGAIGAYMWLRALPGHPGLLAEAREVVISPGGVTEVGDELAHAGVIDSPLRFRLLALLTRGEGPLRASEFSFPPHATLRQVLTILRTAKPVEHMVTIPEGLTAPQVRAVLDRAPAAAGSVGTIPEGSVLPRTYSFERGAARTGILSRAQTAMERELAAAWASRAPDLDLASQRELLTLASIVEKETSKDEERPLVAAVYLNRLRQGMRLQADPTVVFAASGGTGLLDRRLTRADLDRDDPYNTYRNAGLPPGPICSPGIASIRAVAKPARTEDLYFVADGQGGHVFSRTLDDHNRNVARWRALTQPPPPVPPAPPPATTAPGVGHPR